MYDLENYETVKQRKKRFYHDNPDGSITAEILNLNNGIIDFAIMRACVFKTKEDQEKNLPTGTGNALEIRDKEKSISRDGKEYESVNYSSWLENAEESAVGRALDQAGYSGNDKCSREEMEKVQRMNAVKPKGNLEEAKKHVSSTTDINKTILLLSKREWTPEEHTELNELLEIRKKEIENGKRSE